MQTILVIVSSTRQSCRERLVGIHQYAREHGLHIQVVERLFRKVNVRELLETWNPIGIIAECGAGGDELTPSAFGKIPVVYIDADKNHFGKGFYVCLDTASVGRMAASYLLTLDRPNYAYVPFPKPIFWCDERRQSFVDELSRQGRPCQIFRSTHGTKLARWLSDLKEWLRDLPRPCAVFVSNDGIAEHVVNTCAMLGYEMPDDVAVLGVDNEEPICENCSPTLSSVAVDFPRAGYRAAELLDARLQNTKLAPHVCLYGAARVVARQTTRQVSHDKTRVIAAVEYIRRHACEGIKVGDVVREMGLPRRTAEFQFRKVTGHSVLDEINDVRFAKVFELLANPRQSLKTLPDICGFPTGSALRKAFRIRTGISMSAWKKCH